MIKVYFESSKDSLTSDGRYAELVAIFDTEEIYMICLPSLEVQARDNRMIVTESLLDTVYDLSDVVNMVNNR